MARALSGEPELIRKSDRGAYLGPGRGLSAAAAVADSHVQYCIYIK